FAAAWSAIRPNVGKTFLLLARAIRADAADACRAIVGATDLRKRLTPDLSEEELRRVEDVSRAVHLASAKTQIVVHALLRAARRERLAGTGREEAPVRRGIPDWQRWMSAQPTSVRADGGGPHPGIARVLAGWPVALAAIDEELERARRSDAWVAGAKLLRRRVLAGAAGLPHPIELQWTALRERGFSEAERQSLVEVLAEADASMPSQTMGAARVWVALGAPEIAAEG